MDAKLNKEQRKEVQRRLSDFGPPKGLVERRVNIERRLFDLGIECAGNWGRSSKAGGSHGNSAAG